VSSSGHLSRQEQDTAEFERDILPKLVAVPIRALAAATGLSVGYCRRVKKGTITPHPMWWEALRTFGDA
jgi:hypothetical protein